MTERLRRAVGAARVKICLLVLRRLPYLAEHLTRRRLIEADGIVLGPPDDPNCLEHPQYAEARYLRGELRLLEGQGHERDGTEVVHLVGLRLLQRRYQRRQVAKVTGQRLDVGIVLDELVHLLLTLAGDKTEDVVALGAEELREVLP